uniref:Uncharacterized protein n=1 Tax=Knipowitschia caucasica TaxID=637954 RepID=A0AAV2LC09_KNICA
MFIQKKRVFFDHDYATDVQQRIKEYAPIKKLLKENQIRFQTPLTRIHIHFDTGSVTCNDPHAVAAELENRGFRLGQFERRSQRTITLIRCLNFYRGAPWARAALV